MNAAPADSLRANWRTIALLCLGAAAVRIVTSSLLPNVAHPDETFQYLEQAWRLVTGHGLIPWEYEVGARSWLLPWIVTPPIALAHLLSSDPTMLRILVGCWMSLLSTGAVIAAYRIGLVTGGRAHALFAGLLTAYWAEIVQLSPHMLADTISAITLIGALAAGARLGRAGRRELFLSGLLFGFTIIFRPQLGLACALAGLVIAGIRPGPRWLPMAAGVVLPILLLGITDWLSWGAPFQSVALYVRVNGGGIADLFGTAPPGWYVATEAMIWGLALPAVVLGAAFGARRAPLLLVVALIVIGTFSAVPHKEWRFIFPALPILFALCGIGTVDLARLIVARVDRPWLRRRRIYRAAGLLWIALSLISGARGMMRPLWLQDGDVIAAFDRASADPQACAIGIAPIEHWAATGRVRIRPDMRLFGAVPSAVPRFNYLLSFEERQPTANYARWGFSQLDCDTDGVCLYRRPGGCARGDDDLLQPIPAAEVAALLATFRR